MKFSKKYINKFCKNIISSPDIIITATIDTNALKNNIQYLTTSKDVYDILYKSNCNAKGQFLIKLIEDLYFGLSSDGVICGNSILWYQYMENEINSWISTEIKNKSINSLIANIVNTYYNKQNKNYHFTFN